MKNLPLLNHLRLFAAIVLALWTTNLIVVLWLFDFQVKEPGQIGDIFGASNALFTGLGLLALAITLSQQSQQIHSANESTKLNAKLAVLPILIEDLKTNIVHRYPSVNPTNLSIAKCEEIIRQMKPGKGPRESVEAEALLNDLNQLIHALTELRELYKLNES